MRYVFKFSFSDRNEENLGKINKFLGAMELTSCKFEDVDCYSYVSTHYDYSTGEQQVASVNYGIGFDSGTLVCDDEDGDEKSIFQIDTAAFPAEKNMHSDQFVEEWRNDNPNKLIRILTEWEFDNCTGFAVIYQRKNNTVDQSKMF